MGSPRLSPLNLTVFRFAGTIQVVVSRAGVERPPGPQGASP